MVPVVANVLARPISNPREIVQRLVEQVTGTVRWRECVECMANDGVTTFYEIGAGTSEIRRMLIGRELFAETL